MGSIYWPISSHPTVAPRLRTVLAAEPDSQLACQLDLQLTVIGEHTVSERLSEFPVPATLEVAAIVRVHASRSHEYWGSPCT